MKCTKCQTENKEASKSCRKCGTELVNVPLWKPGWKWHARTIVVIYGVLIGAFFLFNHLLKPYMREIPKDITPWLQDAARQESVG